MNLKKWSSLKKYFFKLFKFFKLSFVTIRTFEAMTLQQGLLFFQVVSTSGNHLQTDKKRRILRKMGAGYFKALNDSDFSDPDEILVVKSNRKIDENSIDDFLTGDDGESRSPTLYDAGFQV